MEYTHYITISLFIFLIVPQYQQTSFIYNPMQNGWDAHTKLATISDLFLIFNGIALNPVDFPLPLFNVEYARFSSRFCGRDIIEMGVRGKENKDEREWKQNLK